MRSSDAATLVRVGLVFVIVYLIIAKIAPWLNVLLIAIAFATDWIDGYLAVREESGGAVGLVLYLSAALGNKKARARIAPIKANISKHAPHGPRMDVAGDRVMEYAFWLAFIYVLFYAMGTIAGAVAIFVVLLVVVRHAFADALMGARGTSSKMNTKFAKVFYTSNASRGAINVVKFLAFAYLVLFYALDYPAYIEYALVALLFLIIMLRGAAEIYESTRFN